MRRASRVLAVIPARGGSKGLPGKHLLSVDGRPLIAWTIDAALQSRAIDRAVLSSDDEAIRSVARHLGCDVPFARPEHLASDNAASLDVVLHALDELPGFDTVMLLQPTSPLRTAADIDAAYQLFQSAGATSCVSVAPVEQNPYWMFRLRDDQRLDPLLPQPAPANRRQDLPPIFALNGAIYIADVATLRCDRRFVSEQTIAYVMPIARSIDIDSAADFHAFRVLVTKDTNA
jgi:CMP-N,N'-diacetyllegionaminic acid synthase